MIMVCNASMTIDSSVIKDRRLSEPTVELPKRKNTFRRLASTRGLNRLTTKVLEINNKDTSERQKSGWVRIYAGPEPFADMKSQLLFINRDSNVKTVSKKLSLNQDLTIWIQFGGGQSRRLSNDECPLEIQDEYLIRLGFDDISRRSRLGIDPDLRYILRLHGGYACPSQLPGIPKSAPLQVLKGLVFPNWKRRPVALIDTKLLLYPGCMEGPPEILEMSEGEIELQGPKSNRLVLRATPPLPANASHNPVSKDRHIFFGFDNYWERNLWFAWLKEATQQKSNRKKLDITKSGCQYLPDESLFREDLEEFHAGQNDLHKANFDPLLLAKKLQKIHLNANKLTAIPDELFELTELKILDVSHNDIEQLPEGLTRLECLEELNVSGNSLSSLPESLQKLSCLKTLEAAKNQIKDLPDFLLPKDMRTLGLLDIHAARLDNNKNIVNQNAAFPGNDLNNEESRPLSKVNLRDNQLKGSIILGNYGNLTQLDVSDNSIEKLDLSALNNLEVVQCTKNQLQEISLNGRVLISLVADWNNIEKMRVKPPPIHLQHMDVSHNNFSTLPDWLGGCHELRILFASHNKLTSLPEHLFCSELSSLHTLRLGYNKLHSLPSVPRLRIPLQEIFLQNNCLHSLPPNFFAACDQLKVLNLSNNRLTQLPNVMEPLDMEKLFLTANCLNDHVMETLRSFYRLRVLHIAYNCLTMLPEHCVASWSEMEELVLSGNNIQHLPNNLAGLPHVRILRVHSNRLQSTPTFAYSSTLRVLDLAHNELDVINLVSLVPKQLQFLDISCNIKLRVDPKQFHMYRSQRPMSLVDVSGQNRITLPSQPWPHYEGGENSIEPPWRVGFSETSGNRKFLCTSQIRLPAFCNIEGLFGLIDGGSDNEIPLILAKSIPRILLEERAVKETANEYMKYTILSTHRELKERGQRNGACITLCHISRAKSQPELGFAPTPRRYILRIASVGEASAILVRPSGPINLNPQSSNQRVGFSENFPHIVPNPEITQIILQENDEFLILANKKLWEVIDVSSAIEETRAEKNVILAAKRLQDLAQGYGAEDNLSIMIVRFNGPGSDVDQLMRELRHTIKKTKNSSPTNACQAGCCCEFQNNCCHVINQIPMKTQGSDRSSPSGQSDQTTETVTARPAQAVLEPKHMNHFISTNKIIARAPQTPSIIQESIIRKMGSERRSCRGVAKAIRARIEEQRETEREDTDSAVSEEQFKCWEYMLEQNTQLLFDKELNTLSKGFTRNPNANLRNLRNLSSSSPQLAIPPPPPQPPLLTRHFGSARSYNPANFRPEMRYGSGRSQLNGGPHAAYFGSLQRLMPYNLEYDFAVIQERSTHDSLDQDGRMQQYWGVATTEL